MLWAQAKKNQTKNLRIFQCYQTICFRIFLRSSVTIVLNLFVIFEGFSGILIGCDFLMVSHETRTLLYFRWYFEYLEWINRNFSPTHSQHVASHEYLKNNYVKTHKKQAERKNEVFVFSDVISCKFSTLVSHRDIRKLQRNLLAQ